VRALLFDRTGPPEVLRVGDLPEPTPGPGEVRVAVHCAGVQPFDTAVRGGTMNIELQRPQQLGNEFAGVIDQIGRDVAWPVGTEVLGWAPMTALADFVCTPSDAIVAKPEAMPWLVAGCLGASGQTALSALAALEVGAGDTLLVHAAAGGAGSARCRSRVAPAPEWSEPQARPITPT
jgi:NADPH:quinone reductase-like Zn-dependent oxidoreductase